MPLANYANGTGNIRTYTTNTTVIGYGTTFLTQLQLGAVIGNVSNVFVGYVSNINSNTSITLTANANVAISSNTNPTNFHFKAMTANIPKYVYSTVGNITANVNSAVVTGNSTTFTTQVSYGDLLYVANGSYPNVYLGRVEYIVSNTSLYLNANSLANVSNLQYFNSQSTTNFFKIGPGTAYDEPNTVAGLYTINSQMFRWAQSGLIPNVSVVNNYHPPIRDSVTGVLVNLPASIYAKQGNSVANIYAIGTALTYSGTDYVVKDFDVNQRVFGTDAAYVTDSLHNSSSLKDVALNANPQEYNNSVSQLLETTSADSAAKLIGGNIARVTDTQTLAIEYFSKETPLQQIQKYPQNLTANQDFNIRKEAKGLRKLIPTGAPIAVPGLLNAIADVYLPNNTVWSPPSFSRTNVK